MRDIIGNNWKIDKKIGEGKYADVYLASKKVDGVIASCAVKHISLPKHGESINDLIASKTINDASEVSSYYDDLVTDLKKDFMVMKNFEGNPYFLNCYEWFQETRDDGTGIDIYIRMEKAKDLNDCFKGDSVSEEEVLKLGLDIASALEVCEKKNIIHKDIKPENIFYGEDGNYKLGDFGVAITSAFISKGRKVTGTYSYMSKEAYNKEDVSFSTDIYSLGLVMYMLLNNGNIPFQEEGTSITDASKIRLSGKDIPRIKGVSNNVNDIILKACSFDAKDRYQSASLMKEDIKKIISGKKKKNSNNSGTTVSVYNTDILEKESISLDELDNNENGFNKKKVFLFIILLLLILLFFIFIARSIFVDCRDGYVKDGIKCVKGYYYCDEEYELKNDKCVKTLESVEAQLTYSCNEGFNFVDGKCIKHDTKEAKEGNTCSDGYTLKDNKCIKTIKVQATAKYSCPNSYTLSGTTCVKATSKDAIVSYSCSSDYTLSGSICKKSYYDSSYLTKKVTCSSDCTLNSSKTSCSCTTDPDYWYYCSKGTYSLDGKCHYTEDPEVTYSCSSGTYQNNSCYITSSVNASAKYSCDKGYTLSGKLCIKNETTNPSVKYSCSNGYTLSGDTCTKTESVNPIKGYTCNNGYVLVGKECILNEEGKVTVEYKCSKLYELNEDNNMCEKYKEIDPHIKRDE